MSPEIISVIIGGVTLLIALIFDIINQYRIIKDNEPQLSFKLREIKGDLFLMVTNNGATKASNIIISIEKLFNNGSNYLQEDFIFTIPFELAPNEEVQGMIAFFSKSMASNPFPYVKIKVSYTKPHKKKKIEYERNVFFSKSDESKINVDTGLNLDNLNKTVRSIHMDILRLSNYFSGQQLSAIDMIDLLPKSCFQNDIVDALNREPCKIKTRTEILNNPDSNNDDE